MLDEAEPRLHKVLPADHYAFGNLALERALIAQQQGDAARALELVNQAVEIVERFAKQHGGGAQFLPMLLVHRASIETDAGQLPLAERDARQALALLQVGAHPGDYSCSTGYAYLALARALSAKRNDTEARTAARDAAEQLRKTLGADHADTRAAEALGETTS